MALCTIWSFVPRCLMWSAPGSPQPPPTSPQCLVPMFRKSLGSRWLVGMIVTMDQWSHQRDRKDMRKWFVWPQKDRNVNSYLNCDKLLFGLFGSSYQCITVLVCSSNNSGSLLIYFLGFATMGKSLWFAHGFPPSMLGHDIGNIMSELKSCQTLPYNAIYIYNPPWLYLYGMEEPTPRMKWKNQRHFIHGPSWKMGQKTLKFWCHVAPLHFIQNDGNSIVYSCIFLWNH